MLVQESPAANLGLCEGDGVEVGAGVGEIVEFGIPLNVGLGFGVGETADLIATPLFQTSFLPFLIHV